MSPPPPSADSDLESNTSSITEFFPNESPPMVFVPRKYDYYDVEKESVPDYGAHNVILDGRWTLEASHLLPHLPFKKHSFLSGLETDNSLLKNESQDEYDPLIPDLKLCRKCERRFTARRSSNFVAIFLTFLVIFLLGIFLFPWGLFSLGLLVLIPRFIKIPICKKCRRKQICGF